MPTILDKQLIRDTGMEQDGKPVYVILNPGQDGGSLEFKSKGSRKDGVSIPLRKIFNDLVGTETNEVVEQEQESSEVKPKIKREKGDNLDALDMVDLRVLERRIAIDARPEMANAIKNVLMMIIREIREEAREEAGEPPVYRGRANKIITNKGEEQ
jgi:hypothetical protein